MTADNNDLDPSEVPPIDEALTQTVRSLMPLGSRLQIAAREMTATRVVFSLPWSPDLCTVGDVFHGGVVMALADSAGGASAFANLPVHAVGTSTIESKTNFLAAAKHGELVAIAVPLHVGGSTIVVETGIYHLDDRSTGAPIKLVAKTTQTQTVLTPRSS